MSLREVRNLLLQGYDDGVISDEEFLLLYELNTSKNPDFPYWEYGLFDLDKLSDDECMAEFRFFKNDIYALRDVLNIPEEIVCYNRTLVSGTEALCMLLKRLSYPVRYSDMIPRFGRSPPECSIITSNIVDMIFNFHSYRLSTFQQAWLSRTLPMPRPVAGADFLPDKNVKVAVGRGIGRGCIKHQTDL